MISGDDLGEERYDSRQLDKMRASSAHIPGVVRFHHLGGLPEQYVLTCWHVSAGDGIIAPQVIAVIETDSFIMELEAFDTGVLLERCFAVGDVIPDGAVVARIELPGRMC